MQEEKPKRKNRQADGGAAERYRRVQSDIERQQENAERGARGLDAEEAEALAGEIAKLLADAAQVAEWKELSGATQRFDIVIQQQGNRLVITTTKREPVLEKNPLPEHSGEPL